MLSNAAGNGSRAIIMSYVLMLLQPREKSSQPQHGHCVQAGRDFAKSLNDSTEPPSKCCAMWDTFNNNIKIGLCPAEAREV